MQGIYAITCVPTGKRYIGSSKDIHARFADHKSALRLGRHHSIFLQRAWNKYGETSFSFAVLQEAPKASPRALVAAEARAIRLLRPEFNTQKDPRTSPALQADVRKKMSDAAKRRCADPEYKRKFKERMSRPDVLKKQTENNRRRALENPEAQRAMAINMNTPEAQKKANAKKRGAKFGKEHKDAIAAGLRRFWASSESQKAREKARERAVAMNKRRTR